MTSDTSGYEEDVKMLKEWYSKQPHLPQNINDYMFYNFVSGTKSLQKAKKKIDAYFTLRTDAINTASDVLPHTKLFKNHLQCGYMVVLPDKTPDGYRVLFTAMTDPGKVDDFNVAAFILRRLITAELAYSMWPKDTSWIAIDDFTGLRLDVLSTFNIRQLVAIAKLLQKGIPMKWKGAYFMNSPPAIETILNITRPLITKKITSRFHLNKDTSKLKEYLPLSMIPEEYGGQGRSLKEMGEEWNKLLESKQEWFEEMLQLRTDETKRSTDSFKRETLDFGMEGSFKSLSFD